MSSKTYIVVESRAKLRAKYVAYYVPYRTALYCLKSLVYAGLYCFNSRSQYAVLV